MRLRRFKAPTMRDAMARVRAELGEDAIIVASEETPDGVEVTAAAERAATPRTPVSFVATESGADLPLADRLSLRLKARARAEARAATVDHPPADIRDLEDLLAAHRFPLNLARRIAMAARACEAETDNDALSHAIRMTLSFQPVGETLARPALLVGLAGAGKTVTAAKLAARAVLAGQAIDFVTADAARAGALAQAKAFASVLNQDICEVRGPDELALLLDTRAELGRQRPCIVDTPALNPLDRGDMDQIARLVQAARPAGVEPIAVIAAGGDGEDAEDAARVLAGLGCRRAIITRCDATRRLGGALGAVAAAGLALAGLGIKPYLAGGLVPATPARLAGILAARGSAPRHAPTALPPFAPDPVSPDIDFQELDPA